MTDDSASPDDSATTDAPARSVRVDGLARLEPTPQRREGRRLAAAMRLVISNLVATTAEADDLASAADRLEEIAAELASLPGGHTYEGFAEAANAGAAIRAMTDLRANDDPERFAFFDHSPLIGLSNPLAPPMEMDYDSGDPARLRARVVFGAAYEGPPGCVHGGFVAAAFDELLGATQSLSGTQGMTAHLDVDYRSPTPLGEELTMTGWLDRTEGRKIWARATLHAGDRLCAESQALFLAFQEGTFQSMLEARDGN